MSLRGFDKPLDVEHFTILHFTRIIRTSNGVKPGDVQVFSNRYHIDHQFGGYLKVIVYSFGWLLFYAILKSNFSYPKTASIKVVGNCAKHYNHLQVCGRPFHEQLEKPTWARLELTTASLHAERLLGHSLALLWVKTMNHRAPFPLSSVHIGSQKSGSIVQLKGGNSVGDSTTPPIAILVTM